MGLLKEIAAGLYGAGVAVRNRLYDLKILRSTQFDIPVVCVGNVAVGGTGKTPTVEFLIKNLSSQYTIAVLSRGYRRRTKGYIEVKVNDSFLNVGDEPKQIKRKFPDTVVVVCENRVKAIRRIQEEHPEVNLIVMDDGFQHRSLTPKVSIVLSDYTPSQLYRANIFLITKTPKTMSPIERNIAQKELKPYPYQSFFFTDIKQGNPKPIFSDVAAETVVRGSKVVALSAIANPERFHETLDGRFNVVEKITFDDHHTYKVRDIKHIAEVVKAHGENTIVITTEKDGVKLTSRKYIPEELQRRLFVLPIEINFRDGNEAQFIEKLNYEIKTPKL